MSKANGRPGIRRTQEKAVASQRRPRPTPHNTAPGLGDRHKTEGTRPAGATPTCRVIHSEASHTIEQGLSYVLGVSAETADSQGICMHLQTIPPGGRARAHLHANHETAIYVLSGTVEMWYGEVLQQHLTVRAGDFLYIPAGMPHLPANGSPTEPCIAVIARTDPDEHESVVLLPELDRRAQP
jgi:uncharacterized RmlC-like cupin family protein